MKDGSKFGSSVVLNSESVKGGTKLNKKQLNTLVARFQTSRSNDVFDQVYAASRSNLAVKYDFLDHDILTLFHDSLMYCVDAFDETKGDFVNFLEWKMKNKVRSDLRSKTSYNHHYSIVGEDSLIFENLQDSQNLEADFMRKADQRQLAGLLARLCEQDATTTAIVEAGLRYLPDSNSVGRPKTIEGYIESETGIDKRRVKRIFKRLASVLESRGMTPYSYAHEA